MRCRAGSKSPRKVCETLGWYAPARRHVSPKTGIQGSCGSRPCARTTHGSPGGSELSSFISVCQPPEVYSNLLVTAYASDGVRERALSAGCHRLAEQVRYGG